MYGVISLRSVAVRQRTHRETIVSKFFDFLRAAGSFSMRQLLRFIPRWVWNESQQTFHYEFNRKDVSLLHKRAYRKSQVGFFNFFEVDFVSWILNPKAERMAEVLSKWVVLRYTLICKPWNSTRIFLRKESKFEVKPVWTNFQLSLPSSIYANLLPSERASVKSDP